MVEHHLYSQLHQNQKIMLQFSSIEEQDGDDIRLVTDIPRNNKKRGHCTSIKK
jgi:hypothetical protein